MARRKTESIKMVYGFAGAIAGVILTRIFVLLRRLTGRTG
jgi:hypothetical protein